jgi:hypothetical protein
MVSGNTGSDTLTVRGDVTLSANFPPPSLNITATTPSNWVYQNSGTTTTKNRHHLPLTISVVTDTYSSASYTATVTVTPTPSGTYHGLIVSSTVPNAGGIGALTITSTCSFLHGNTGLLHLVGGPVLSGSVVLSALNKTVAKTAGGFNGQYTVNVSVAGSNGGVVSAPALVITLRLLGDMKGLGVVQTANATIVTGYLASSVPHTIPAGSGFTDPSMMDLQGLGVIQVADATIVTKIVAGIAIN